MIYEILFNPVTPYYPSVAVAMGLTLLTLLCSSFTSNCGFMIAIFRSYSEDSVSKCSYPHFMVCPLSFSGLWTLAGVMRIHCQRLRIPHSLTLCTLVMKLSVNHHSLTVKTNFSAPGCEQHGSMDISINILTAA